MKTVRIACTGHGKHTFAAHGRRGTLCHVMTRAQLAGRIQNACKTVTNQRRRLTPPGIAAKVMSALLRTDRGSRNTYRWCGSAPYTHTTHGILVVSSRSGLLVRPTRKILSRYLKQAFTDHGRNHALLATAVTDLVYGAASRALSSQVT